MPDPQRDIKDLYVYEPNQLENSSPFEVFLAHTDEKEQLGKLLVDRISQLPSTEIALLDVGCGDGSLAASLLAGLTEKDTSYTGIDPVQFNIDKAAANLQHTHSEIQLRTVGFEDFQAPTKYDVIIASNLYHLGEHEVVDFIHRLQTMLLSTGVGYFIYRDDQDDILTMRQQFESRLYEDFRLPRTARMVINACLSNDITIDNISRLEASIHIPDDKKLKAKILEFIFNRTLDSMPETMQSDIDHFVTARKNTFTTAQKILQFKP